MGPKQKSKKKGEKKKKTVTDENANAEPEIQMEEGTKQFYSTQIQSLRKKVTDLQEECDGYLVSQQKNAERLETLKEIRLGSRAYLGRQMDEINLEINHLNRQLRELDELKESERAELTKQINDLRTKDLQETKEKNENENHMLRSKLNSLDELKSKKETLLSEINQLDEQLKQQEHEYQEDIYHREKAAVLEKDKLIKDMIQKMNHVAADFRRASNKQMAETTKRTINENARIEQTVNDMEDVATRVHHENEQIHDGNNHLHMGIQTLKKKEQQHAFQHATSAEIIQLLANMLQNQEEIIVKKQEQIAQVDIAERRIKELRSLIFNNEKNYPDIRQQNKSFNEKLDELNKLITTAAQEKAIILSNLRRAVLLVTETLKVSY
ncbi:unnamed protein product [Rotaria sp. Silwood1]|nr:unnamed protein product [Rotaria sp. Silwood1]